MFPSVLGLFVFSLVFLDSTVRSQPGHGQPVRARYSQVERAGDCQGKGFGERVGERVAARTTIPAGSGAPQLTRTSITTTTATRADRTKNRKATTKHTTITKKVKTKPKMTSSTTETTPTTTTTSSTTSTTAAAAATTTTTETTTENSSTSTESQETDDATTSTAAATASLSSDETVFTNRLYADFSSATAGGDVAAALANGGLYISTAQVSKNDALVRQYSRSNVNLGDGQLEMTVSAYNGSGTVYGSSVLTSTKFTYASTRVVMKSTAVEGICIGHFFYESDQQETDIEILTSSATEASANHDEGVWFSNQAVTDDTNASKEVVPYGFDPSAAFHEYRIDWMPTYTAFFIDGEERGRITDNVPSEASAYVLNGWSDGGTWSMGPPTEDGTFAVKSVEILYGYTG